MSGRGSRGGRGSTSAPPDSRITRAMLRVLNQKTLSQLCWLSYALSAMGEFADVANRDATLGFTECAELVGTVQSDVPRTIQEERASPDTAKWNAADEREMKRLNDRKVYNLVPRSADLRKGSASSPSGCLNARPTAPSRDVSWPRAGTKISDSTAAARTLRCAGPRACEWWRASPWSSTSFSTRWMFLPLSCTRTSKNKCS